MRRVASERLGGAIDRLDSVLAARDDDRSDIDVEAIVHDVRKRCKAARGLARLAKPALGDDLRTFDRAVRDAANQLSTLRDAHAVLGTVDALLASNPDDDVLRAMRDRQAARSVDASRAGTSDGDDRIATARALLAAALEMSQRWKIPRGFDVPEAGIVATYRQGRTALRRLRSDPTDDRLHEWRKAVKYLWYQMQLVHDAAPSVLGPLVAELDQLAEALGDDHDLTVLVDLLDAHDDDGGADDEAAHVRGLARQRQAELRAGALRSGATIYAEPDHAFGHRVERYWRTALDLGPERILGAPERPVTPADPPVRSLVERERRFLVEAVPEPLLAVVAAALRQGYLATGERRSVRVRDAGPAGCTLTFKAGAGAERTELEWPIERREFEAAWPHTDGRRIEKTRQRIPYGDHVIELDVFGGELTGLVIAEVEFSSAEAMAGFDPPAWFGSEVTDDGRYTNASLALHGLPDER
jgi:CYTH domain-containing protein/CHAD domain-containing protein